VEDGRLSVAFYALAPKNPAIDAHPGRQPLEPTFCYHLYAVDTWQISLTDKLQAWGPKQYPVSFYSCQSLGFELGQLQKSQNQILAYDPRQCTEYLHWKTPYGARM
jgi:hypothetical protein